MRYFLIVCVAFAVFAGCDSPWEKEQRAEKRYQEFVESIEAPQRAREKARREELYKRQEEEWQRKQVLGR